ncbi:up-regulator of cell proliferation-like [Ascaphus truei]|uniref:up-regulator of cell proliferation-like n=1 Tax=Ascaphus truei TaxID=8439 RepID=UPI003F59CD39
METGGRASRTLRSLQNECEEILQMDVAWKDLSFTREEQFRLKSTPEPRARNTMLIQIVLRKGESACQEFLHYLEKRAPPFPWLAPFLQGKRKPLDELLSQMQLEDYRTCKLSLKDVLHIGEECVHGLDLKTSACEPWRFLRKLVALDETARNTRLDHCAPDLGTSGNSEDEEQHEAFDFAYETDTSNSSHPLDVLCALLHCSDSFLQQEIVSKMTMCQFAVPLLLPAGDGPDCTLMLWAMRDIGKRWRPQSLAESKGFREDSLVHIPMPTFSFVRLGECNFSKSKFLNQVLSPAHAHHFFVHRDLECGYSPRKISDGLVEISWYFPGGRGKSDIFPEPIAVTNLRGDLESNWKQFSFLTQVSSAVFVFAESFREKQCKLLSNSGEANTNYYFIICPTDGKSVNAETKDSLKKYFPVLKMNRNVLVKSTTANEAEMVKQVQGLIRNVITDPIKPVKLVDMTKTAKGLGIQVDESSAECQEAREHALKITKGIKYVVQYKKETMQLQGDLWKQLSENEKELCRMRKQGNYNGEDYRAKLIKKRSELHKEQNQHDLPGGMKTFIEAITDLSPVEKHYFLKWMKFDLDSVARNNLSVLQDEYKKKCYNLSTNMKELKELDQRISDSSLGIEHFFREVGQFYEAECSMVREGEIQGNERQFTRLPGAAADLLLDGFPLELIDGDASNIPLQWVTDVLTELDNKTRGRCRMRVITVLGVQSTGKSTLLNTMFGLQFPVASGRCTRGAFMTLIKVKENFQEELGCDFILVIDTEGLKAPELASREDSYEHDNELATLVVGLSDITIVNMAMENTAEMKDILQIVVHAFLRMREIGKKPNCQFVHQNVSDVSAHDKNMRARKKLLEQLNEMTKAAAKMEKKCGITTFCDIMDYDIENHNWYIPGLWNGVPPMAPVNSGYSENIFELKNYLFEFMKTRLQSQSPQNIRAFIEWVKSLWNAVKHEKFIFSFRNSLVAEAYNQLSIKYSQLEWDFRKEMHNWIIETKNVIRNQSAENREMQSSDTFKFSMYQILEKEEKNMLGSLETYFESGSENMHLVQRYREDFFRSVKYLRNELEEYLSRKCSEAIRIQKGKHEIEMIQDRYVKTIEEKVSRLVDNCRRRQRDLNDIELKSEFESMWNNTFSGFQLRTLTKHNVDQDMQQQLKKDMTSKSGSINERLLGIKHLADYAQGCFTMKDEHIDLLWYQKSAESVWYKAAGRREYYIKDCHFKTDNLVEFLLNKCNNYVKEKVSTKEDYHDTFCQELLNVINERLQQKDVEMLHTTDDFELDLKLLILGRAAPMFQKMHEDFVQKNDPNLCLESLKSQYFATFESIFQEKDECQTRARHFCELCLKPALAEYVNNYLGKEIVSDILTSVDSMEYRSRTFFQFTVLRKLLEENRFDQYVEYINKYESFVKQWILKYITDKYGESRGLESLQLIILSSIFRKVRATLKHREVLGSNNVSDFLANFCKMLNKELVISQNDMKVITFQNTASIHQFSADIESFLTEAGDQIISQMNSLTIESVLSEVTLKPEDELFKKVFGCGKQCPFCKVPCEAGAADHKEHFASVHRPQGLGSYRDLETNVLCESLCSTDVVSNRSFRNSDTEEKLHPYKDYRTYYPDWAIQPDPNINASDYWKFILKEFNKQFAERYRAKPAALPEDWHKITREQALQCLKETFHMK